MLFYLLSYTFLEDLLIGRGFFVQFITAEYVGFIVVRTNRYLHSLG